MKKPIIDAVFCMVELDSGLSVKQLKQLTELAEEYGLDDLAPMNNDQVVDGDHILQANSIAYGLVPNGSEYDPELLLATAEICNDFEKLREDNLYEYNDGRFILIH